LKNPNEFNVFKSFRNKKSRSQHPPATFERNLTKSERKSHLNFELQGYSSKNSLKRNVKKKEIENPNKLGLANHFPNKSKETEVKKSTLDLT
jgi:hypothetical protein